jgi:hypothetical protein
MGQDHSHDHVAGANARMLGWALALTATFLVVETTDLILRVRRSKSNRLSSRHNSAFVAPRHRRDEAQHQR